jgi:hypothetical protein
MGGDVNSTRRCKTNTGLLLVSAMVGACLASACDSASRADSVAAIELEADGVRWTAGRLQTQVTARLLDTEGRPVEKVLVSLAHQGESVNLDPAVATSDADGRAVFTASTDRTQSVEFRGRLDLDDLELGDPLPIEFDLELGLTAGAVEPTHPGGRVEVEVSVADAGGPVAGVPLRIASDRGAADTIAPERADSDAEGRAGFTIETMTSGPSMIQVAVDGLDLTDPPTLAIDFSGPRLSGRWSLPQPSAELFAPRLGLLWVEDVADPTGQSAFEELCSQALEPLPHLGDAGQFELSLPLHAPEDQLYPPSPDLPEDFVVAPYVVGIYDDRDGDGLYSEGDPLVAATDERVLLVYAEGSLPDPGELPDARLGYQYMELGEADPPPLLAFDTLAGEHDLTIRMAPCPTVYMEGWVRFGDGLDAESDIRLALILVDANLIFSGQADRMFDVGNFVDLASIGLVVTPNDSVEYMLELPHPGDAHPSYQDYLFQAVPGIPAFGIMAPVIYVDSDHNGVFTNDDNDVLTGDRIVGAIDLPFGYGGLLVEWLDGDPGLFAGLASHGLNQGFNLLREPIEDPVTAVIDDHTLELQKPLEPGWTELPFRIERRVAGQDRTLLQGDDLATTGGTSRRVVSSAGGFSGVVQPGDRLVITNQIEDSEVLDFDTSVDLRVE